MESPTISASRSNRSAAVTFTSLGTLAIVIGGLFSAATARSTTYHSAWFVAYTVLVVGVAQVALGLGQWWLASRPIGIAIVVTEVMVFNLGNTGVILGTVIAAPLLVDLGSALVAIALIIFGWSVWHSRRRGAALLAYWVLVVLLLVSVLVGLFFAHATGE